MKSVSCRVGILYRGLKCIKSIRIPNNVGMELYQRWMCPSRDELEEIEKWLTDTIKDSTIKDSAVKELDRDTSYMSYFYRCLEEGSEYYYLYEKDVGWSCGDVTGKSPISSKFVKLEDAISQMEEWAINLKYADHSDK